MYCCNKTFIILALFLILFCDNTSSECTQLASCICCLSDGYYYNLTDLADKEILSDTQFNWTVYFHPCKNVPVLIDIDNNTCGSGNGVSLCLHNTQTNEMQNLGTVQDTQMKLLNDNNSLPIFEIHHTNVTSVINILCVINNETHFRIDVIGVHKNNFILKSPYGCKRELHYKSLSTGSILVILFFTFSGIYFIGGAIILKTLRGATGWEMLPNHNFWREFPSLVRDGIVFIFNCCRADSYERI